MITADDVKELLQKSNVERITVYTCTGCNYPEGYIIRSLEPEHITYDKGCHCKSYIGGFVSSLQEIANCHNLQTSEEGKLLIMEQLKGGIS